MTIALPAAWRPTHRTWARGTGVVSLVVMAAYLAASWWSPWQPGRLGGLIAGSLAAALFVAGALYPLRRRWGAWPFGTAQRWLQFHLYGTSLAALLVLVHMGFRLPAGLFGWLLFVMALWTTASGVFGVYLQKTLPVALARNLRVEAIADRIPGIVQQLAREADAVMAGAPDVLTRVYQADIRPMLEAPRAAWTFVSEVRTGRARSVEPIEKLTRFVEEPERGRLAALEGLVNDKLDLDVHLSVQRVLRGWLVLHVPPAMLLLGLLVVHVFAVVYL